MRIFPDAVLRASFPLLILCLCCPMAFALDSPAPLVDIKEAGGGKLAVSATLTLPVRPCEVYAMLTDYDHLPSFIPGLLQSSYERISANRVKVRQLGEVQVLFFHVQMNSLLEMEETPNQRIVFRQIEGDLASYGGQWDFAATEGGSRISYDSTMSFKGFVPLFIARSALRNEVEEQFAAIAKEALARKNKGTLACLPDSG